LVLRQRWRGRRRGGGAAQCGREELWRGSDEVCGLGDGVAAEARRVGEKNNGGCKGKLDPIVRLKRVRSAFYVMTGRGG
jgi:hypothetical protein